MTFLRKLIEILDEEIPNWRADTWFMLDGASYHTGIAMQNYIEAMELTTIICGPYSAPSSPIEKIFAYIKTGDLNPAELPVGKR